MKNVIILILSCLSSVVSIAQNMPFDMDSLLAGKEYQLVQYLPEEVMEMDSSQLLPYYEGGVLVQPLEKIYSYDTFYTAAYEDIPSHKLEAVLKQMPTSKEIRIIVPQHMEYLPCQLDSIHSIQIKAYLPISYTTFPSTGGKVITDYTIKSEFAYQYPNGLPKKLVHRKFIKKKPIRWLSLSEWEIYKQGKNITQLNEQIYIGGEKANYWYFPAGYYAWWDRMMVENTPVTTYQIKKALIERGYDLELDNIFDSKTKAALTRFIKDNNIPTSCMAGGHINVLKALGVSE